MGSGIVTALNSAGGGGGSLPPLVINIASDFPTVAEANNNIGRVYIAAANVTDNDVTKTNTGQSFLAGDEFVWNGISAYFLLGPSAIWLDTGTDVKTVNPRNIDLQANGLKDTNVTTAIKLGDALNTFFSTTNKTIVGAVNELSSSMFWSRVGVDLTPSNVDDNVDMKKGKTIYGDGTDTTYSALEYNNASTTKPKLEVDSTLLAETNLHGLHWHVQEASKGAGLHIESDNATAFSALSTRNAAYTVQDFIGYLSNGTLASGTRKVWAKKYDGATSNLIFQSINDTTFINRLTLDHTTGLLSVGTTTYEALVVSDNDIPNKKYVDDAVTTEDFWDRAGTTVYTKNAGDNILTSGGGIGNLDDFTDYSLNINVSSGNVQTIEYNPGSPASISKSSTYWQSFTMIEDAFVSAVSPRCASASGSGTFEIRQGEGLGGTVLVAAFPVTFAGGSGFANIFTFPSRFKGINGQKYTWVFYPIVDPNINFKDGYAGGTSDYGQDYLFRVYKDNGTGITVDNTTGAIIDTFATDTASTTAFTVETTIDAEVDAVTGHKSKITGYSAGFTGGEDIFTYWAEIEGSANDTNAAYNGFIASINKNGGTSSGRAFVNGGDFDVLMLGLSGDINFRDYDATIEPVRLLDGNGNNVTISGGAGLGTDKDGGNLLLNRGLATGTGSDGKILANTSIFEIYDSTVDVHPMSQIVGALHGAVGLSFDAYWDGSQWLSSASTNAQIFKSSSQLTVKYESGIAQGSPVTWDNALTLDLTTGNVNIGDLTINGAYTLPSADGTSGYVMKTNGLGAVTWQADTTTSAWGEITGTLSNQTDLQNALDAKEPTLTKGNLTETTSSVLTITGATGAVIGSGVTVEVDQADTSNDGYLNSTDWNTFNGKQAALTNGVDALTTSEVSQLANINAITISNTQWGYLGAMNQGVANTDSPTFVNTKQTVHTDDVSNPPTDAQLDALFGTPATVGSGFTALLDDNGAGTNMYVVRSNGTNWFYTLMAKAV